MELWIGLTVCNPLPRTVWVLRLAVRLVGYLLLGGAFPFGHCSIPCTHRSGPYRPAKIFGG
ncbi:hypothetical protein ABTA96_19910, partial [Acinetobacter baumannii]